MARSQSHRNTVNEKTTRMEKATLLICTVHGKVRTELRGAQHLETTRMKKATLLICKVHGKVRTEMSGAQHLEWRRQLFSFVRYMET